MKELKFKVMPEKSSGSCEGCYLKGYCNFSGDQIKIINNKRYNCDKDKVIYVEDTDEEHVIKPGSLQAILDVSNPKWKYIAMDNSGGCYVYINKPLAEDGTWRTTDDCTFVDRDLLSAELLPKEEDWKDTLLSRTGYIEEYICPFKDGQAVLVSVSNMLSGTEYPRVFKEYKNGLFFVYPNPGNIYSSESWDKCRAFKGEE